ncbi:peptidoglycan-binding protein [Streptomyces sp. NBC_00102]|uniref:L,D-transpeptidase family protein n=1 Tax=Streptomyces sp. NBC_00102 TaxID=2975652 RepID=UPI00224D168F|nr:peptidoglycan-binding protein [Streptomyces sp. NBC_00102]MCX5397898.1 peptidoglycan-binding protein [Streptomyces sp. NBC_00102]
MNAKNPRNLKDPKNPRNLKDPKNPRSVLTHPANLRAVAVTAVAAGLLSLLGVAAPAGTASAQAFGTTAPARHGALVSGIVHPEAKGAGVSHAGQWPTLRSGSRGTAVTAVQHLLSAHGHAVRADGVFGARSTAAVKGFQRQRQLRADGVVGADTWRALAVTVRSGSRGHAVTAAQVLLGARGHAVKADGVFGSRTVAAVKGFQRQRQRQLHVDGVVGADTWRNLAAGPVGGAPAERGYVLRFARNWTKSQNSKLSLYRDGRLVKSYRAGSGSGSTDECAKGKGWLPAGTYKVLGHQTNRDTRIKGYAIRLQDKVCHPERGRKAVLRGDLFIHSNMTKDGASRWRGNYASEGCVKLSPNDIRDLFSRLNSAHWPKNLTLRVG